MPQIKDRAHGIEVNLCTAVQKGGKNFRLHRIHPATKRENFRKIIRSIFPAQITFLFSIFFSHTKFDTLPKKGLRFKNEFPIGEVNDK